MANTIDLQLNLRVQMKMLEKQAIREEKNADKEQRKAKASLAKGERNFAALYAQNAVRSRQHAQFLRENAAKLSSIVCDLKMAETQAKVAKALTQTTKELEKAVGAMDLDKIAAMSVKYDQIRGKVNAAADILSPESNIQGESEDLLDQLESEIMVEMDSELQIPAIPEMEQQQQSKAAAGAV